MCTNCGGREFYVRREHGREAVVHVGRNQQAYVDRMRFIGEADKVVCRQCRHQLRGVLRDRVLAKVLKMKHQTAW